jgi:Ca-activated chloride channel family protein
MDFHSLQFFHFLRPYAFYELLLLLPIIYYWWQAGAKVDQSQKVCDSHLLSHLLVGQSAKTKLPLWCFTLAYLISVFALAGPTWEKQPQPLLQKEQAVVILLDTSISMLADDIKPSRIQRAKYKVLDILKSLKEGQVALIAYTEEPFVVSPLTQDAKTIANLVPAITPEIMPVFGSDLNKALNMGADLISQAGLQNGSIIIVTDSTPQSGDFMTAKKLKEVGIDLSVLAVGTEKGGHIPLSQGGYLKDNSGNIEISKLDPGALKTLAKSGGGAFTKLTPDNKDVSILTEQVTKQDEHFFQDEKEEITGELWQDNGHWLLLLVLPFLLLSFRRTN